MAVDDDDIEEDGSNSFRLLFVTLSMILLAFFILLNSMATLNDDKKRKALGSLLGSFGLLPGSGSVDNTKESMKTKTDIVSSGAGFTIFKKVQRVIQEMMAGNTNSPKQLFATFNEQTGEVKIVVADEMLFAPGSSVISPRMFHLLGEIARMSKDFDGFIRVVGHTDPRGDKRQNWRLSLSRGMVVARHLESAGEFAAGRVSAVGNSFYTPVQPMDPRERSLSNRRVEILVTADEGNK
ncbi:MAG: OmpA family protein [Deltaproteobacteria bacterium]|nr:OmpA family protein [Deltaproteobacteria bacterium]MBN2673061.1 OmpA family protein [Deltaproteobacteria bacterium]